MKPESKPVAVVTGVGPGTRPYKASPTKPALQSLILLRASAFPR
jgi:hypothetical protein